MENDWKDYFLDAVKERFFELKSKNGRFSVRGFAGMAKLSPAAMSAILNRSEKSLPHIDIPGVVKHWPWGK